MTTMSKLRSESLTGGRVKGVMVRAHLQFVRDRFGEPALALIMKALPAAVAAEVQGILASTWCAFESLVVLDRTIAPSHSLTDVDLKDIDRGWTTGLSTWGDHP